MQGANHEVKEMAGKKYGGGLATVPLRNIAVGASLTRVPWKTVQRLCCLHVGFYVSFDHESVVQPKVLLARNVCLGELSGSQVRCFGMHSVSKKTTRHQVPWCRSSSWCQVFGCCKFVDRLYLRLVRCIMLEYIEEQHLYNCAHGSSESASCCVTVFTGQVKMQVAVSLCSRVK